jgi:hypothetical protein
MKKIPSELNAKILNSIKEKIIPDTKLIMLKVFVIHLITALVTLSICPQLGFSFIRSKFNLMDIFMKIGPHFCDFACGAFFTTMSMTSILFVLSRDEIRFIRHKQILLILTLILTSLGFLFVLNPQLFIQFSLLWLLGTIGGIIISMQIGIRILKFL